MEIIVETRDHLILLHLFEAENMKLHLIEADIAFICADMKQIENVIY
jgi:hypothetical protein